jgi:O-antigen/teichoic acid export membrane protein
MSILSIPFTQVLKARPKGLWRDGFYSLAFQIGGQFLRMASNMLLAWMLVPEDFGLMAIVNAWIMGVQLFSDIGFGPGLQRSANWDKPEMQWTAYTLQVVRGLVLMGLTLVAAPYMQSCYQYEGLQNLMMFASLSLLISGLSSVELHIHPRRKLFIPVAKLEFKAQLIGTAVGILYCTIEATAFCLVLIPLVSSSYKALASFGLKYSHRPKLRCYTSEAKELVGFGSVVFICTALHFGALHSDRFLLGLSLSPADLGVYAIALALASAPFQWITQMGSRMVLPLMASQSHLSNIEMEALIKGLRKWPLRILSVGMVLMLIGGAQLIEHFYKAEYKNAPKIFQILLLGMWPMICCASIDPLLYVRAKPWAPTVGNALRCLHMLFVPWILTGEDPIFRAMIWISLRDIWFWLAIHIGLYLKGFNFIRQDLEAIFLVFAGGIAVGYFHLGDGPFSTFF